MVIGWRGGCVSGLPRSRRAGRLPTDGLDPPPPALPRRLPIPGPLSHAAVPQPGLPDPHRRLLLALDPAHGGHHIHHSAVGQALPVEVPRAAAGSRIYFGRRVLALLGVPWVRRYHPRLKLLPLLRHGRAMRQHRHISPLLRFANQGTTKMK
ncbi:unnamed protein product [Urochloa humidicola]